MLVRSGVSGGVGGGGEDVVERGGVCCLKINFLAKFPVLKKVIDLMKDLKYEHQSGWVVGWLEGGWFEGSWVGEGGVGSGRMGDGGVGGWRVHGVGGCVVVWVVLGLVVGGFIGWVHILTHP